MRGTGKNSESVLLLSHKHRRGWERRILRNKNTGLDPLDCESKPLNRQGVMAIFYRKNRESRCQSLLRVCRPLPCSAAAFDLFWNRRGDAAFHVSPCADGHLFAGCLFAAVANPDAPFG